MQADLTGEAIKEKHTKTQAQAHIQIFGVKHTYIHKIYKYIYILLYAQVYALVDMQPWS